MTHTKDILLLYREPYSLFILKEALQEEGYKVTIVHTGEEALKYIRRSRPDLISVDINLPRKSGIMFYHALRRNKEWARIPLVTISGETNGKHAASDDWDVFDGRKVFGPSIYLEKPVRLEDFLELIHRALGYPPQRKLLPTEIEGIRKRVIQLVNAADENQVVDLAAVISKKRPGRNVLPKVSAAIV